MPTPRTSAVHELPWNPGEQRIPFLLGSNCLDSLAQLINPLAPDRILLVCEAGFAEMHHHGQQVPGILAQFAPLTPLHIPSGESAKTLGTLETLARDALAAGATRRSCVVSLGGGLACNLAGMLAATLYRGLPLLHIPTTLLAMHDTVTSLKQAVNIAGHKNLVGVYHRPSGILCDVRFAQTLPPSAIQGALVELVKNALVLGEPFIAQARQLISLAGRPDPAFLAAVVQSGVAAKRSLMVHDPYERSAAIVFEYGHTIGHAIEACVEGKLNHGQCIYWGMLAAGQISLSSGLLSSDGHRQHQQLMSLIPDVPFPRIPLQSLLDAATFDNKRGHLAPRPNCIQMVLLQAPGKPAMTGQCPMVEVPTHVMRQSLISLPFVDPAGVIP